uniref:RNA dependent RNA polymerase n=1 Tax=Rhizopus microsporus mitovirus 4 TaxID=3156531 RepID=A0AAT9H882_9VIRU
MFQIYPKLVLWMIRNFYRNTAPESAKQKAFVDLQLSVNRWLKTRGPLWTAERSKLTRLAIMKYLEGSPLPRPAGLSLYPDGLPTVLGPLADLIRDRDLRAVSAVMSVLSTTRSLLGGKPVDTKPLTEPSSMTKVPGWVHRYKRPFMKEFGLESFDPSWKEFHFTTKAGPNGPALVGSLLDLQALSPRQKELIYSIGGKALEMRMRSLEMLCSMGDSLFEIFGVKRPESLITAKISVKPDKETKSRLFGILDYFTQTALREIHLNLFRQLKKIPSDKTFAQTKLLSEFRPDKGSSFHSIDLTAATDRFPIDVQEQILAQFIGRQLAANWKELLQDRDYFLNGKPLRYGAGQPMGVYSSWAVFTMCHHFVVYAAARECNIRNFRSYILLGDDIVIANDQVAASYKRMITELGCTFSEAKTHTSKEMFEFAKRWFANGVEFSPFPLSGLGEVVGKYHLLYPFLVDLEDRGFTLTWSFGNPVWLKDLLKIFGKKPRQVVSYLRNLEGLAVLPKGTNVDLEQAGTSALALARLFGFTMPCRRLETLGKILSNHMSHAYGWATARSAEKAFNQVVKWQRLVADKLELDLSPGSDNQSELGDLILQSLVPINVLAREADRAMELIEPEQFDGLPHEYIWDKTQHTRMLILPTAEGLIPQRKAHQLAASRAGFLKLLVMFVHNHRVGKRMR